MNTLQENVLQTELQEKIRKETKKKIDKLSLTINSYINNIIENDTASEDISLSDDQKAELLTYVREYETLKFRKKYTTGNNQGIDPINDAALLEKVLKYKPIGKFTHYISCCICHWYLDEIKKVKSKKKKEKQEIENIIKEEMERIKRGYNRTLLSTAFDMLSHQIDLQIKQQSLTSPKVQKYESFAKILEEHTKVKEKLNKSEQSRYKIYFTRDLAVEVFPCFEDLFFEEAETHDQFLDQDELFELFDKPAINNILSQPYILYLRLEKKKNNEQTDYIPYIKDTIIEDALESINNTGTLGNAKTFFLSKFKNIMKNEFEHINYTDINELKRWFKNIIDMRKELSETLASINSAGPLDTSIIKELYEKYVHREILSDYEQKSKKSKKSQIDIKDPVWQKKWLRDGLKKLSVKYEVIAEEEFQNGRYKPVNTRKYMAFYNNDLLIRERYIDKMSLEEYTGTNVSVQRQKYEELKRFIIGNVSKQMENDIVVI